MRTEGKNPEKAEGYSDYTAYETAYRTARFDRWAWNREERYSIPPEPNARRSTSKKTSFTVT